MPTKILLKFRKKIKRPKNDIKRKTTHWKGFFFFFVKRNSLKSGGHGKNYSKFGGVRNSKKSYKLYFKILLFWTITLLFNLKFFKFTFARMNLYFSVKAAWNKTQMSTSLDKLQFFSSLTNFLTSPSKVFYKCKGIHIKVICRW